MGELTVAVKQRWRGAIEAERLGRDEEVGNFGAIGGDGLELLSLQAVRVVHVRQRLKLLLRLAQRLVGPRESIGRWLSVCNAQGGRPRPKRVSWRVELEGRRSGYRGSEIGVGGDRGAVEIEMQGDRGAGHAQLLLVIQTSSDLEAHTPEAEMAARPSPSPEYVCSSAHLVAFGGVEGWSVRCVQGRGQG